MENAGKMCWLHVLDFRSPRRAAGCTAVTRSIQHRSTLVYGVRSRTPAQDPLLNGSPNNYSFHIKWARKRYLRPIYHTPFLQRHISQRLLFVRQHRIVGQFKSQQNEILSLYPSATIHQVANHLQPEEIIA